MEIKKQKSIDIVRPSTRQILSWKNIQKTTSENTHILHIQKNNLIKKIEQKTSFVRKRFIYAGAITLAISIAFLSYQFLPFFQKTNQVAEVKKLIDPYDYKIDKSDYAVDFSQIRNEKKDIDVGKVSKVKNDIQIKNAETILTDNPTINTEIVYGNSDLKFENANITLKKDGPVNAIITCDKWDEEKNICNSDWQLAKDIAFNQNDKNVSFSVKHFSAYAGAYLNIINLQSNLTKGDTWTVNFQTYSKSDLKIEAVDGTNFDEDIQFQSIFCGDTEIPSEQIERNGNTLIIRNYQCDNRVSNIKNTAVTAGRHWLAFSFGDTIDARAHNFACDSGTLNDTCTVSSAQTMADEDTISGTGNLVVASGGDITAVGGENFTIDMDGDITVQSGGSITGNVVITSDDFTVDNGGSINLDGKGYAGGYGPGTGGYYTQGANYGGTGANNTGSYGSLTEPVDLGSGGGGPSYPGGSGGGAIKMTISGIATVNGSITANGAVYAGNGGGSGGSIWIITNTITGNGSITVNGGSASWYGGAAGGRISIQYTTDTYTGTKTAYGTIANSNYLPYGGAGTIFTKSSTETYGNLYINNNAQTTGITPLLTTGGNGGGDALWQFDNNTSGVTNGGYLRIDTGATLTDASVSATINGTGGITVLNGGTLSLPNATSLTTAGTLTLTAGTLTASSLEDVTLNGTLSIANAVGFPTDLGDMIINSGGILTHAANTDSKTNYLDLTLDSLTINSGGAINVNGKGYAAGYGPGAGPGGGYGGIGGASIPSGGTDGGPAYGSLTSPIDLGSGGSCAVGGGAVKLTVNSTANISGSITANGGNGVSVWCGGGAGGSIWITADTIIGDGSITSNGGAGGFNDKGGGSGGRIAIRYATDTYSGTKTAYGAESFWGGDGGSGTIYTKASTETYGKLFVNNNALTTGVTPLLTTGGNGGGDALWQFDNNLAGITNGGYLRIDTGVTVTTLASSINNGDNTTITLDGGILSASNATNLNSNLSTLILNTGTISAPSLSTDVTVTGNVNINGGTFTAPNTVNLTVATSSALNLNASAFTTPALETVILNGTLSLANAAGFPSSINTLTINSGGILTHIANTDTKTNYLDLTLDSLAINSGGIINLNEKGYAGGYGPGAGTNAYGGDASGAGYGGKGGDRQSNPGGVAYGSAGAPIDLGSGGGNSGGKGGGAIKFTVSGSTTINGSITTNGGYRIGSGGPGGGAGGSILIYTDTISGSGSLTADGGTGYYSGGGGGGRVAIYYTGSAFSGSITVAGGPGSYGDPGEAGTIVQDGVTPDVGATSICSVPGNGCTLAGESANPQQPYIVDSIAGSATIGSSGINDLEVSIKDTDVSVNKWYNPSNNSFDQVSENWIDLTQETDWSYDTSTIGWVQDHTYQIRTRIQNGGEMWSTIETLDFTYTNSPPTVSNVTASQNSSGETVAITYDVTDIESGSTTIYMLYEVEATLNEELTNSDSTAITVSDANHLPDSGTIMIDDEMISYTEKSGNDLQGTITRGANNTTNMAHSSSTTVWINEMSATGNVGSQTNGTDKSVSWGAGTDNDEFYSATSSIRISANDGSSGSMVGSDDSADFILDTKNPTNVSMVIDHNLNQLTMTTPTDDSSYQMYLSNYADFNDATAEDFSSPYTYTNLTSDPATVYLRIQDDFGNHTDIPTATPAQAQNLKFYDTSSPLEGTYQEFISWNVVPANQVGAGFEAYNIYQKTDEGAFVLVKSINDRTFNYYMATGLSSSSEYTFKLTVEDIEGNTSLYSGTVTDIPNGYGSSETTPPTIEDVVVSNIETTSATVTWTTEEISDSSVGYSEDYTYLPERGIATMTTTHEVTLTGLNPGTTYNIKVKSRDVKNNLGSVCYGGEDCSPGSNNPSVFEFTTDDGPAISQITIPSISNTQATIVWKTNTDSSTYVGYTDELDENGDMIAPVEVGAPDLVGGTTPFNHSQTIDGLTPNTTYYFYVKSIDGTLPVGNVALDNNGGEFYELLTTEDLDDPIISAIDEPMITDSQAAIYWLTDEPASSQVEYSETSGGPYTPSDLISDMNRSHYVILSNLDPLTTYYYRVISEDINGNSSTSAENSFTTLNDPEFQHDPISAITDISDPPSIITDTKAVITFNTDQPAKCAVEYGTQAGNYSEVPFVENDYNENHSIHVTGLIFDTQYFYQITCEDNLENSIVSDEHTFTTSEKLYTEGEAEGLGDSDPPEISSISVTDETGESVTVTWKTDEEANSSISYGIESGTYENGANNYLVNSNVANYVTSHSVIINNLTPSTKYYFKVVSVDATGNIGESGEETFTTDSPSSLSSIKVSSTSLSEVIITWTTSEKMTSVVEYGTTITYGETKSSSTMATAHEVKISGLKAATIYHFRVKGTDADNNIYSSGDYTFEPKSPPKVTGVNVDSVTEHGATITVSTDIPTDTLVTYFEKGNETNAGSQGKPDFAAKHEIKLSDLKAGTIYSYTVKVSDEQGNQTTNEAKEFTTEKDETPPAIDNIHADSALAQSDKVQTIISCKTDEQATASVFYREGKNGEEKELKMSTNLATAHVAVLTSFKPGTVYNFKIVAKDASDNVSISQVFSLLTPIQKENIIQVIVNNFQDIFGWMR